VHHLLKPTAVWSNIRINALNIHIVWINPSLLRETRKKGNTFLQVGCFVELCLLFQIIWCLSLLLLQILFLPNNRILINVCRKILILFCRRSFRERYIKFSLIFTLIFLKMFALYLFAVKQVQIRSNVEKIGGSACGRMCTWRQQTLPKR